MKIEIKEPIHALLAQLPAGALLPGDIARLNLTRAFIKALRTDSDTDDLAVNVFHDGAALALADGITDALRGIIADAIPKRDGRRRPAAAAQALNAMQTFQGRTRLLKDALTAYKKVLGLVPGLNGPEAIGKLMRPAFAEVTKTFDTLLELQPPSEDAADTLEEMKELSAKLAKSVEMYATTEFASGSITKADGPATSPTLLRWITACGTLSTQAAEAIRSLKNPG